MYNPMINPMINPYMPGYQQPQAQHEEVTKVNGENGARSYQIGPNSSALLLDESGLLVWLITTDGAGYKTVSPYDISPHKTAPSPDFTSLEERIARLEALYNGNTGNSGAARSETAGSGQLVVPVDE
jgi:hypothetical protein